MRNDSGQAHVLEAVLVSLFLIGGVAFVVSFDSPTTPTSAPAARLERDAGNVLIVLDELEVDAPQYGNSTLSKIIAEALQGNTTNLTTKLSQYLPPGARYNLYISNGYGQAIPVYESGTPSGEAVSVVKAFDPGWSYIFLSPDIDKYDPDTNAPMVVYAIPIFNGNVVDPGGAPVGVVATGKKETGGTFTLTGWLNTVQGDSADDTTPPHVSIYYWDLTTHEKTLFSDVTDNVSAGNTTLGVSIPFRVVVNETEGVDLEAGATLNIRVPPNWNATAASGENPGWTVVANATNASTGGLIQARLNSTLNASQITFNYTATYKPDKTGTQHTDYTQYYTFPTYLTGAAQARSELLVRVLSYQEILDTNPLGQPEQLTFTGPNPMGRAGIGTWGVGVTSSTFNFTLTGLRIYQPDGLPLFANLTQLSGPAGTWLTGEGYAPSYENRTDTLLWEGSANLSWADDLSTSEAEEQQAAFVLEISSAGVSTGSRMRDPLLTPLDLPSVGSNATFWRETVAPGMFVLTLYPTNETSLHTGYYGPAVGADTAFDIESSVGYRLAELTGLSNYTITAAPLAKDTFLAGGSLNVDSRALPLGSTISFEADLSALLLELARANMATQVTLKIHPPWSAGTRNPVHTQALEESFLLDGSVSDFVLADVSNDSLLDVVVGTTNGKVYAFNGTNGFKVPGRVFSVPTAEDLVTNGTSTGFAAVNAIAKYTYADGSEGFLVATDENSPGIYLLDGNLSARYTIYKETVYSVTAAGQSTASGQTSLNVTTITGDLDLTGDSVDDIVFATAEGAVYLVSGATRQNVTANWPFDTLDATPFLFTGSIGFDAEPGVIASEGQDILAFAMPDSPLPFANSYVAECVGETPNPSCVTGFPSTLGTEATEQLRRVSIYVPEGGLAALDRNGSVLWEYKSSVMTVMEPVDIDGDGITDIAAGDAWGGVYLLNGSQPSTPAFPSRILTGTKILDAEFLNANNGYTVSANGFLMYTDDGFTNNQYATANGTNLESVPGARGIGLVNKNVGFIVGNGGLMWRFGSEDIELDPAKVYSVTRALKWNPTVLLESAVDEALITLLNLTDVAFFQDPTGQKHDTDFVGISISEMPPAATCAATTALVPAELLGVPTDFCDQPALLWTSNSGQDWTYVPLENVTADLNRIQIAPGSTTAYVVGDSGTVLKVTNANTAAYTVTKLSVPTTFDLHGLDFLNESTGYVVGDDGTVLRTTNGGANWTRVYAPVDANLLAVDFADANNGIIAGETGAVLRSWDGGGNWTWVPRDTLMDYHVVNYPDVNSPYAFGGNETVRAVLHFASHRYTSNATIDLGELPSEAASVTGLTFVTEGRQSGHIQNSYEVSVDGGETWIPFAPTDSGATDFRNPAMWAPLTGLDVPVASGDRLKLRVNFSFTEPSYAIYTPMLKSFVLNLFYEDGAGSPAEVEKDITFTSDGSEGPYMLEEGSTLEWNTTLGELRAATLPQFWHFNANNASITALNASTDFDRDGVKDIVIGTGAVYTVDSFESGAAVSIGGYDRRVYVLDGRTGGVIFRSEPFDGDIQHLAVANLTEKTGVQYPEIVVLHWNSTGSSALNQWGRVDVLNISLGGTIDAGFNLSARPAGLLTAFMSPSDTTERAIVGTRALVGGTDGSITTVGMSGEVMLFRTAAARPAWRSSVDAIGEFSTSWTIPRTSLFGAYIVETEIKWQEIAADIDSLDWTGSGVQTGHLFNYFVVTPPNGRIPKTPLYNLELVVWYDDWT